MARRTLQSTDAAADLLWKWFLRLLGASAFIYVALVKDFNVPSPAYIGIFGLIGLPHVYNLQQVLRKGPEKEE